MNYHRWWYNKAKNKRSIVKFVIKAESLQASSYIYQSVFFYENSIDKLTVDKTGLQDADTHQR